MIFTFHDDDALKLNMSECVTDMIDTFSEKFKFNQTAKTPASDDLFKPSTGRFLSLQEADLFHATTTKGLHIFKRAGPDIQTAIAVLTTRVSKPQYSDWLKLRRLTLHLNDARDLTLTLSLKDGINCIKWYVDAAFAVHSDFESHTGATVSLDDGSPISVSRKQKLNTESFTIAEPVGVDDAVVVIL